MTSGFLFLILFLIATRKPSLLDRRLLTVVALGCAITAAFVLEFALQMANGPLTVAGFLFYNTLFDENASCHLAFGEAYAECIRGGEKMTKEELRSAGLNDSITHVDFMVGTADLTITGYTRDGREVPVFVNGNFAL